MVCLIKSRPASALALLFVSNLINFHSKKEHDDQRFEARQTFLNFRSKTTTFAHLKNEVNRT